MNQKVNLNRTLKRLLQEEGLEILNQPEELRQQLEEIGVPKTEAITVELVLTGCPSIVPTLLQGELSVAEANVLVSCVVRNTLLPPSVVRRVLGALAVAANVDFAGQKLAAIAESVPDMLNRQPTYEGSIQEAREDEKLRTAIANLQRKQDHAAALSDLENLVKDGNAYASYVLGCYYHEEDQRNGTEKGYQYYSLAAKLGYGPAYGALAEYEMKRNSKGMHKAAKCFEHPTALAGQDGRKWTQNASKLLSYREENKKRSKSMILWSVLALIFAALICTVNGVVGVFAVLLALFSLVRSVYLLVFSPYYSHKSNCIAILVCWVLAVLALV